MRFFGETPLSDRRHVDNMAASRSPLATHQTTTEGQQAIQPLDIDNAQKSERQRFRECEAAGEGSQIVGFDEVTKGAVPKGLVRGGPGCGKTSLRWSFWWAGAGKIPFLIRGLA